MICWVAERASAARNVQDVIIATDDERVLNAVEACGHHGVMTRSDHSSGTDRIAEVIESFGEVEIVVNVQGDEPLLAPDTIERAVDELIRSDESIGIVTTWEPIENSMDVVNPDVVKIVVADDETAVYFSRSPVPYPREAVRRHGSLEHALRNDANCLRGFRKHTGLYVYRRDVLLNMAKWQPTKLEQLESLEQLRALEHGVRIKAIRATTSSIGVDTTADLERVRSLLEEQQFQVLSN
jgi:3-deoxy-manno-octulosonate cytidylyltransferase (CMP-KDO synthetase)